MFPARTSSQFTLILAITGALSGIALVDHDPDNHLFVLALCALGFCLAGAILSAAARCDRAPSDEQGVPPYL
jgi:hypothetical protein